MLYTVVWMNMYMLWSMELYDVPNTKCALNSSSKAPREEVDLQGMALRSRMMKNWWTASFLTPTASRYG
jgi:hypothetical protein